MLFFNTFLGVFICRGKEDALVTKNMVVGESVYGEKRISVEVRLQHLRLSLFSGNSRALRADSFRNVSRAQNYIYVLDRNTDSLGIFDIYKRKH